MDIRVPIMVFSMAFIFVREAWEPLLMVMLIVGVCRQ